MGGGVGTLVLALVVYFMGGNPAVILNQNPGGGGRSVPASQGGKNGPEKQFVSVVLADTEDVWGKIFKQNGRRYRNPKLVLFTDQVQSACGVAGTSVGPFYCPNDEKLYLDLAFFREMKGRLGAPGDFAQAYVIAHEVGHHVQKQLGTLGKVHALERRVSETEANRLSVKTELQADYFAGVWAHYAAKAGTLDPGDAEEALNAASAVGNDRLQQRGQGYIVPDSFTHGTSAQRVEWFEKGMKTGDPAGGDTFVS